MTSRTSTRTPVETEVAFTATRSWVTPPSAEKPRSSALMPGRSGTRGNVVATRACAWATEPTTTPTIKMTRVRNCFESLRSTAPPRFLHGRPLFAASAARRAAGLSGRGCRVALFQLDVGRRPQAREHLGQDLALATWSHLPQHRRANLFEGGDPGGPPIQQHQHAGTFGGLHHSGYGSDLRQRQGRPLLRLASQFAAGQQPQVSTANPLRPFPVRRHLPHRLPRQQALAQPVDASPCLLPGALGAARRHGHQHPGHPQSLRLSEALHVGFVEGAGLCLSGGRQGMLLLRQERLDAQAFLEFPYLPANFGSRGQSLARGLDGQQAFVDQRPDELPTTRSCIELRAQRGRKTLALSLDLGHGEYAAFEAGRDWPCLGDIRDGRLLLTGTTAEQPTHDDRPEPYPL